jgi:hypothetical protein
MGRKADRNAIKDRYAIVGGALLGAFIFEPLRQRIKSKSERKWYDHLALTLTDSLGAANSFFERVLGLKTEVRIQFRPPALASHEPFNARPFFSYAFFLTFLGGLILQSPWDAKM